jgi:tyrosine-protein phosphatase SIW14
MTSMNILNRRARLLPAAVLGVCLLAVPVFATAETPGLPNFHQVNDRLYRGAQPSDGGFQQLAKLGVKTVVDLRETGPRATAEQRVVESLGMRYIHVPLDGLSAPTMEQVARLYAIFDDPASGPVFIHCKRGADRTGTVVACYRIAHDHWENSKALAEAKTNGMSWVERSMQRFVLDFSPSTTVWTAATASTVTAAQ